MANEMRAPGEAAAYGMDWPPVGPVPEWLERNAGAHVQVTRTTSILRGNGMYRVLEIRTPVDKLEIYISPTGRMRVFRERSELHAKKT